MNMAGDIMKMDQMVKDHLRLNVMPPVSDRFVDAAVEAIADAKDGDYDRQVTLPTGKRVTAGSLIESWNLQGFLEDFDL